MAKTAEQAKTDLTLFVERRVSNPETRRELSRKIAAYVAATLRDDRASREEPSLFERIFGPSMLK